MLTQIPDKSQIPERQMLNLDLDPNACVPDLKTKRGARWWQMRRANKDKGYALRNSNSNVCMHACKDSAAPAHARTRAHRPAAPHQSSGVSQTPHPTACPQAGIPTQTQTTIVALVCVIDQGEGNSKLLAVIVSRCNGDGYAPTQHLQRELFGRAAGENFLGVFL